MAEQFDVKLVEEARYTPPPEYREKAWVTPESMKSENALISIKYQEG